MLAQNKHWPDLYLESLSALSQCVDWRSASQGKSPVNDHLVFTKSISENEELLKQAICECDRNLVNALHSLKPEFKQYDKSNCKIGNGM